MSNKDLKRFEQTVMIFRNGKLEPQKEVQEEIEEPGTLSTSERIAKMQKGLIKGGR